MKSFFQFIVEADESALESANQKNSAFGEAYETATVIHLHNHTAAKTNTTTKGYQAKIKLVKQKHQAAMAKLPPNKQEQAVHLATKSSNAYMDSLREHEGIEPEHIHEVHHTSQGISSHLNKNVDRASNPHDLLIKGIKDRKSFKHGASLKAKPGTASNNSIASFDTISKSHGLQADVSGHWNEGLKKAKLTGKTNAAKKEVRHDPKIKALNQETQRSAASSHADEFNNATHSTKKKHLLHYLKATPDLPYHYVVGSKGSSVPIDKHPAVHAINKAKSLTATLSNNVVHLHNEKGEHIASVEHRPTHGSFISPQVNFKFGTMKAKQ
jgi:hypothetical protein